MLFAWQMIETPLKFTNEEDGIFYIIETQVFSLDGASASVICLVSSHLCAHTVLCSGSRQGQVAVSQVQPSIGGNVTSGHLSLVTSMKVQ